jgi:hypothetical protein
VKALSVITSLNTFKNSTTVIIITTIMYSHIVVVVVGPDMKFRYAVLQLLTPLMEDNTTTETLVSGAASSIYRYP